MKIVRFDFANLEENRDLHNPEAVEATPHIIPEQELLPPELEIKYNKNDLDAEFYRGTEEGKKQGFDEGKQQGINETTKHYEAVSETILETTLRIEAQLNEFVSVHEVLRKDDIAHLITTLAWSIAKKVAGEALHQEGMVEIESLVAKCLELLFDEPKLTIVLKEDLVEKMTPIIEGIRSKVRFLGVMDIIGDPKLDAYDCRIEWGNGCINHSKAQILETISKVIEWSHEPHNALPDNQEEVIAAQPTSETPEDSKETSSEPLPPEHHELSEG